MTPWVAVPIGTTVAVAAFAVARYLLDLSEGWATALALAVLVAILFAGIRRGSSQR